MDSHRKFRKIAWAACACSLWIAAASLLNAQSPAASADRDQTYRPQFHFSPLRNWTNDPNGLVYFEGEYHLFFQYNPFGDQWGHMTWGHAVSLDLVHWQQLPPAIPEESGVLIFTGSTVVDEHNTSGFCSSGKPCLVAIYTGHTPRASDHPALQTQNLAYSNDRGRHWSKYPGNPVLDLHMPDFRDPKVLWSQQAARWVMLVSLPDEHKVRIYQSKDLKHWSPSSDFGPEGAAGGQWECPELFEAPVEGSRETRWVLKVGLNPGALQGGSGEQYFVGHFDGAHFVNENPPAQQLWTDYGKDCYCALTFNHLPKGQRPIMLGWMDNWQYAKDVPTSPWRGQMTFPRSLTLRKTTDGLRLVQEPVSQLDQLEQKTASESVAGSLERVNRQLANSSLNRGRVFHLTAEIALGTAQEVGLRFLAEGAQYTQIGYDRGTNRLFFDRRESGPNLFSRAFPARIEAPLSLAKPSLKLNVLVDRNSVEVFADGGIVTSTNLVFPPPLARRVQVYAKGGEPGEISLHLAPIQSIWPAH